MERLKIWIVAVRPWAYGASLLSVVLGFVLARHQGFGWHWPWFALTVTTVLCLHTGGNLINDAFDYRQGLDRIAGPGSGAVVRGDISPSQALRAALVFLALGMGCAAWLFVEHGLMVLVLGAAGAFFAVAYTVPSIHLKGRGLGDLAVFLSFGPLPTLGGYWIQSGAFSWIPAYWSLPTALLAAGILHANNWRDMATDTRGQCRTFACRLGHRWSGQYYRVLVLGSFLLVGIYVALGTVPGSPLIAPAWSGLTWLLLPTAISLSRTASGRKSEDHGQFQRLDILTARLQMLFGLLLLGAFLL